MDTGLIGSPTAVTGLWLLTLSGCLPATEHEPERSRVFGDRVPASTEPVPRSQRDVVASDLEWSRLEGHLAWQDDDSIWIADADRRELSRLSFEVAPLLYWAALSPGAADVAFTGMLHNWGLRVFVTPSAGGETRALTEPQSLGAADPMQEWAGLFPFWSLDGAWVYVLPSWGKTPAYELLQAAPSGTRLDTLELDADLGPAEPVGLSADGRLLAVGGVQVVGVPLDRSASRVLAVPPYGRSAYGPAWSPDGTRLAFVLSGAQSTFELMVADADGANSKVVLSISRASLGCNDFAWSPSGQSIAYFQCLQASSTLAVLDLATGTSATIRSGHRPAGSPLSWVR